MKTLVCEQVTFRLLDDGQLQVSPDEGLLDPGNTDFKLSRDELTELFTWLVQR